MAGFDGWSVRAADGDGSHIEIRIYDVIDEWWGVSADDIAEKLAEFPKAKTIDLRVNSPGGDAFAGIAINNLLRQHPAEVTGHVDGYAASAATIAMMGCDTIIMGHGSMWMIHQPWTFAYGNAGDLRSTADFLDKVNDSVVDMYVARTGQARAVIAKMVEDETWLTASEAVDEGFADKALGAEGDEEDDDASASAKGRNASANAKLDPLDVIAAVQAYGARDHERETFMRQGKPAPSAEAVAAITPIQSGAAPAQTAPGEGDAGEKNMPVTQEEHDAVKAQLASQTQQLNAATEAHTKLEGDLKVANEANAELKVQLKASEKSLAETREQLTKAQDENKQLADKALDAEVQALVGHKITAEEKPRFVRLAKADRELFDETVKERPELNLMNRVTNPVEPNAPQQRPSGNDGYDENALANAVHSAKA